MAAYFDQDMSVERGSFRGAILTAVSRDGDRGGLPMRSVAFGMWRHAGGHAGTPSFAKRRSKARKPFQTRLSVLEREFGIHIHVAVLPKFVLLKQYALPLKKEKRRERTKRTAEGDFHAGGENARSHVSLSTVAKLERSFFGRSIERFSPVTR